MGIAGFFSWLRRKYRVAVCQCLEEKQKLINGRYAPIDSSNPNPNGVEFDNLYLDANFIIHSCCTPDNECAPDNEDRIMMSVFAYIDRIFAIVRPRRLLYVAVDGVSPNAKISRMRGHRFQAAKGNEELLEDISRIKEELRRQGRYVEPDKPPGAYFDSSRLTPGTKTMMHVADCLRYYIHMRLNTDPGWRNIMVFLSDSSVPGEGEHKIIDFIRRQREHPDYDPRTQHCVCGNDADLILLGLATHEIYFTIIREEYNPVEMPFCRVCERAGHDTADCSGVVEKNVPSADKLEFIFLRLDILREYLYHDLSIVNPPFSYDIERAIDDWVCLCFIVDNDFLPQIPSLSMYEGIVERLVVIYKQMVHRTAGYLSDSGTLNLRRFQLILTELAKSEEQIFEKRHKMEQYYNNTRAKDTKQTNNVEIPLNYTGNKRDNLGHNTSGKSKASGGAEPNKTNNCNPKKSKSSNKIPENGGGEQVLYEMLSRRSYLGQPTDSKGKVKILTEDKVNLWKAGWKNRYYVEKFGVNANNADFRKKVTHEYLFGICWGLKYYYQGCVSWNWFYPYHYAPFASDFSKIDQLKIDCESEVKPLRPLEQLMCLIPAANRNLLPESWQDLMVNSQSPIIDFYPNNFVMDMVGKRFASQAVVLLPFVDVTRLLKTLFYVYPNLTEAEARQNKLGSDQLFVAPDHQCYQQLINLYKRRNLKSKVQLNSRQSSGIRGTIWCDDLPLHLGANLVSPIAQLGSYSNNRSVCVRVENPSYKSGHIFRAELLRRDLLPRSILAPEDFYHSYHGLSLFSQMRSTGAVDEGYETNGTILLGPKSVAAPLGSYDRVVPKAMISEGRAAYGDCDITSDSCSEVDYSENRHPAVHVKLRKRFQRSGLIERVLASDTNVEQAEKWIRKGIKKEMIKETRKDNKIKRIVIQKERAREKKKTERRN